MIEWSVFFFMFFLAEEMIVELSASLTLICPHVIYGSKVDSCIIAFVLVKESFILYAVSITSY